MLYHVYDLQHAAIAPFRKPPLSWSETRPTLEDVFLFGSAAAAPFGAKIGTFPTKDTRQLLAPVMDRLEALCRSLAPALLDRELPVQVAAPSPVVAGGRGVRPGHRQARPASRGVAHPLAQRSPVAAR